MNTKPSLSIDVTSPKFWLAVASLLFLYIDERPDVLKTLALPEVVIHWLWFIAGFAKWITAGSYALLQFKNDVPAKPLTEAQISGILRSMTKEEREALDDFTWSELKESTATPASAEPPQSTAGQTTGRAAQVPPAVESSQKTEVTP